MATDTKKKSESTAEDTTSTIKVGGDSGTAAPHKSRKLTPLPSGKRKMSIVLAVLVVLVGGALLLHGKVHIGEKVYAQAAGHKIYKQDVQNLIGNTKGVTDRQAATVLADKYLTEALAKEQGITVSDKDLQTAYGPVIETLKKNNEYSYQLQVNQLYFDKLQTYNQGVYKGYLLVGHFSRNIVLQPDSASGQVISTNSAAVAADKKYAQDFLTNLYNQIKAGKITWDQATQMEKDDPTIGTNMYPSLSHSGPFDASKAPISLFTPASAQEQLSKIKAGQISKPFVVSVTDSVGTDGQTFESYFLVVKMDSTAGGKSGVGFQEELQQAKQRLGYKINV
jgi:hypothetical protein